MVRQLETSIDGLVLIEAEAHGDDRGFLLETFREDAWRELGIDAAFVQDNHSRSARGILRGIHFQTAPGQAKLVRCARGTIWDVAVDLRRDSPTYRQWEGHELSDANHRQLFVPVGFGHGFCVLSEEADVAYRLSSYYDPADRGGVRLGRPGCRDRVADRRPDRLRSRPFGSPPCGDRRRAALVATCSGR